MSTAVPVEPDLASELELARQVQASLLPRANCCLRNWEFAYSYEPAGVVGGDYVDLIGLGSGEFYFALGDISGKGVAGAMLMSNLHATLRALISAKMSIDQILKIASRTFCHGSLPAQFATLVLGKADEAGNVELVNAGQTPALLLNSGTIRIIEAASVPLGLFCSTDFVSQRIRVDPGDFLLLYSDGITESADNTGNEFGPGRLREEFLLSAKHPAAEIVNAIRLSVERFTSASNLTDDRTILVLSHNAGMTPSAIA